MEDKKEKKFKTRYYKIFDIYILNDQMNNSIAVHS